MKKGAVPWNEAQELIAVFSGSSPAAREQTIGRCLHARVAHAAFKRLT